MKERIFQILTLEGKIVPNDEYGGDFYKDIGGVKRCLEYYKEHHFNDYKNLKVVEFVFVREMTPDNFMER
jgi:inorganic pyrophosphatase